MDYDTGLEALTAALKQAKQRFRKMYVFKSGDKFLISDMYASNHVGYAYPGGRTVWNEQRGGKLEAE